jgi:hypothetical protein
MKFARLLLMIIGILVVVGAGLLGLVLTPSVQRWAVLRAVRDVPGLRFELAGVSAGFSGVTLRGVLAEKDHVLLTADRVEAEFSLLDLLVSRRLALSRLQVLGLSIDASRMSRTRAEAATVGTPAAAPGLLARLELPFDLMVDEVRIEGRTRMPGATGRSPVEADFTLSGGKLSPGHEGLLQLNATLRNPDPDARVAALRIQAGLRATLSTRRTFDKLSLTTMVEADGNGLSGQNQLKIGADLFHSSTAENYAVAVSTLLHGVPENVLNLRAQLPTGSRQYSGDWDLQARTAQLQPFFLGGELPDFDLKGAGRFTFEPQTAAFDLQGGLQGRVSRLEAVEPAWRALGALKVDVSFDVSQRDRVVHLNRFKALVAGAEPVLDVQTAAALHYDLRKRQLSTDGLPDRLLNLTVRGLPIDWVRPFVSAADVSGGVVTGEIDLVSATAGNAIALRGALQAADLNVVREGRPLLTKAVVALKAEAVLDGNTLKAPLLDLKLSTPAGDRFDLNGRVSAKLSGDGPVGFTGHFNATAAKVLSPWYPGGPLMAQGDLDLTWRGAVLELRPGRIEVRQDADRPVLVATIKQAASFDLGSHVLQPVNPTQPVARLELGRLPLSVLPLTQPDTVLGGYVQQGDLEVSIQGDTTVLKAVAPIKLADVSLTESQRPALTRLAVEALPVIEYAGPAELKVRTGDMVIRANGAQPLLSLKAEFIRTAAQGTQASATFAVELPALAGQPLFAGAQALSAGRASGEVRAAAGTQSQIEARVTMNGLVAAGSGQVLPVANLRFRAIAKPDGSLSLRVPLLLDAAGRRSDMDFALELSPLANGYSVDGRLTGQQVELQDLLGILGVFNAAAAPDDADKPAPAASVPPDKVAAWSHFSGQVNVSVGAVTHGKDWAMNGLTGVVGIEPALLSLRKLEASFSETSRLAAKGELRFTGGAMPYRLTGEYALNDFDAGRLFKAFEPGKAPTVEGLFTINAKFTGNGETPSRAIDRIHGDLQLTSRQGVFRGLQRSTSKLSMTSKAVELGASVLGSILGSEKAVRTAEKVAGQAYFVDQLAQSIGEFNYDLLSVRLVRDELLNMELQGISLVAPEIRLNGRGSVTYVVGKPLLEQPLSVSLNLAARGKIEQLLSKLRLLDGSKDDLGYARTKDTVTVGGTLAKPDPSAFFTRIATAKLADFLDGEN